ncbi:MAG: hypothetical protein U0V73_05430 [Acidimicrobiia bacterium]
MQWAQEITERVNQVTGLQYSLFTQVLSPEVGTLVWSTFLPDLGVFEAATDKLTADDGFAAALDDGAQYLMGGADDMLLQVLHGLQEPAGHTEYISAVRAICADGKFAEGVAKGVSIAQRAEEITGVSTTFAMNATGDYGAVTWFTGHESIRTMEAGMQALASDPGWGEFLDRETAGVYLGAPEATTQIILRRVM